MELEERGLKMKIKPKVLVLASTFPRWKGDTEPGFVYELARSLTKNFDITVLAPHYHTAKKFEIMDGLKVVRFSYFLSKYQKLCYEGGIHENLKKSFLAKLQLPLFSLFEFLSIFSLLLKRKYALIHAHWILPHGFFAVIMKKIFGVRVVVSAHAGDIFPLRNPLLRIFAGWTLKNCNAVTVNSTATKRAVLAIADVPIKVLPMGVDLKLFSSAFAASAAAVKKKYSVKGRMLLFVGRLAEKKGLTYLISAMDSVVKAYPDCKLVIVGDGPEKAALVRQSRQMGLWRNIVFAGSVPNTQLPSFYKAADVFVLPSIVARSGDTEGLGVVLLEAIASETPVVASNVGGIPDIVIDRKTGLLVRQKSPEELSLAIISLLKNKKLQKKLSAAARNHVRKNYSWQKIASEFYSVYSSFLPK